MASALPSARPIRLATRGIVMHDDRLLLVNAWSDHRKSLWCAPGGGAEPHASLPDNLAREVLEETGLRVSVGAPCLINEYNDPKRNFHQVELFFRCTVEDPVIDDAWRDPEGIVHTRRWVTRDEIGDMLVKPSSLAEVAWGEGLLYDPLEPLLG